MRRCLLTLLLVCSAPLAIAADPSSFVGTWNTTYGRMVLAEKDGALSGNYGRNGITGVEKDGKFAFTYYEPGVTGEGVFVMAPDGQSFTGKWRPNGGASWSDWTGKRVSDNPQQQAQNGGVVPVAPGGGWTPSGGYPGRPSSGEPPDEPKPVVYRYGKLPPGLPAYFTEADTDKDGQIGLYEWVQYWGNSEAKLNEFKGLDLNVDGLFTVEEYLRGKKAADTAAAAAQPKPVGSPSWANPPGGQPGWGQPAAAAARPVGTPSPGQGAEASKVKK